MDGDERLTALKKAYADIILNTAKEAAARIMVSERKAIRFEHELNVAKEQALQMLLRLKQTLDSKVSEAGMTYLRQQTKIDNLKAKLRDAEDTISEAESASLIQQRKIDELESQLQEAEDIVKDLREELREVQAELDRVRGGELQRMTEHDIQDQTSQENILNASQSVIYPSPESRLESFTTSDLKNSAFNKRNEVYKCYNENDFHMRNVRNPYIRKPDLPFASEEGRLYTSQFMFTPPESQLGSFTTSDVKNFAFNQRNEASKSYGANDSCMGNSYVSKPILPSIILRSKEPQPNRNRRTQRIRAFEEKLMAGELDVNYETSGKEDGEGEEICRTPPHKADDMCSAEKKDLVEADSGCYQVQKVKVKKVKYIRRKRRGAARYKTNKTSSPRHLSDQACRKHQTCNVSSTEVNSVNDNIQSGGEPSNMTPWLSADTTNQGIPLGCAEVTESDAGFIKAVSTENFENKDKVLFGELSLARQESGSADVLGVPICRLDVEKIDVPVVNSPSETYAAINGIPNQPTPSRVIKYTFQRKRKRESLSSNCGGNASLENGDVKKKATEKKNFPPEIENSSSLTESSRDSRRLAQVARQLVSLSEKKWW